jgi:hypothetical protein
MPGKRVRSVDELFQLPPGEWTRIEGGLPNAQLTFATTLLVRRGGRQKTLHGSVVTSLLGASMVEVSRQDVTLGQTISLPSYTDSVTRTGPVRVSA